MIPGTCGFGVITPVPTCLGSIWEKGELALKQLHAECHSCTHSADLPNILGRYPTQNDLSYRSDKLKWQCGHSTQLTLHYHP